MQANVNEFTDATQFDAVVGRYVLLYQSDSAASLRHVTTLLHPGGVLIFHEMDFSDCPAWPEPTLWRRVGSILNEAFRRAGVPPDFGMRLTRTFLDAGLPRPTIQSAAPVGGEAGSYCMVGSPKRLGVSGRASSSLGSQPQTNCKSIR